jgi:hypothetical protein
VLTPARLMEVFGAAPVPSNPAPANPAPSYGGPR